MIALKSLHHLYYILHTDKKELTDLINNFDKYYTPYSIPKKKKDGTIKLKNGHVETRDICPSIGRLKEIQVQIKNQILKKLEFPGFIHGGVKGKNNITNAKFHKGSKYFFETDIKNFFPSVKYKTVYSTFINIGFSADVSSVLTKLTTYKSAVPQGIPTSTYVTNLTVLPVDKELLEYCRLYEIRYTRFVDDLSFSSKKDFKEAVNELIRIISSKKLKINRQKTYYKIGPTEITGILVKNNSIQPNKDTIEKYYSAKDERKKKSLENYIERIRKK